MDAVTKRGFTLTYIYTEKASLNRPIMRPTLSGRFREVVDLERYNKCMGDRLEPK